MKHYLITQWNCDLYDLDWLKRRQKLFERFTLPSVKAQTNKNFEWLLVSDSRTPDEFKSVLDSYPATVIYYDFETYTWKTPSLDGLSKTMQLSVKLEYIGDIIASYIGEQNEDYIITSRLDNDDAISVDHIDSIQRHASRYWRDKHSADRFWLSMVRGYRWCRDKVYPFNSLRNPFVSFVETPKNLLTCYQCCHTIIDNSDFEVYGIREKGTWLQVIHQENLLNKLKRFRGEMPDSNIRDRFKFNE